MRNQVKEQLFSCSSFSPGWCFSSQMRLVYSFEGYEFSTNFLTTAAPKRFRHRNRTTLVVHKLKFISAGRKIRILNDIRVEKKSPKNKSNLLSQGTNPWKLTVCEYYEITLTAVQTSLTPEGNAKILSKKLRNKPCETIPRNSKWCELLLLRSP